MFIWFPRDKTPASSLLAFALGKFRTRIDTITVSPSLPPASFTHCVNRARIHLSKLTKAYLCQNPEIMIEELPTYAPQLNPEEYCHGNVKQHLRNARPTSKEEIRSMLDRGFARLRRRPDLLLGFFHAAGLSVRQLQLT